MGSPKHTLSRLLTVAAPHRKQIWKASILSVLNKIADLAPPALIGVAVDVVAAIDGRGPWTSIPGGRRDPGHGGVVVRGGDLRGDGREHGFATGDRPG